MRAHVVAFSVEWAFVGSVHHGPLGLDGVGVDGVVVNLGVNCFFWFFCVFSR